VSNVNPGDMVRWAPRRDGSVSVALRSYGPNEETVFNDIDLPAYFPVLVIAVVRAWGRNTPRFDLLCLTPDCRLGWLYEDLATRLL
jgi:hypothetical protein